MKYIIGKKEANSDEFEIIYQNRVFSYEQTKEIIEKYNHLKMYIIVDLIEV